MVGFTIKPREGGGGGGGGLAFPNDFGRNMSVNSIRKTITLEFPVIVDTKLIRLYR